MTLVVTRVIAGVIVITLGVTFIVLALLLCCTIILAPLGVPMLAGAAYVALAGIALVIPKMAAIRRNTRRD